MKQIIFLILFVIGHLNLNSQEKDTNYNNDIFLNLDYLDSIPIYDKLNKDILCFIKHDTINENYIIFKILDKSSQSFYVNAYYSLNEDSIIATGWVNKSQHLGIFSRAYDRPLVLYKAPSIDSTIICTEQYTPKMYVVVDCYRQWLKVRTTVNGELFYGWIPPEMQCANVYSTCS